MDEPQISDDAHVRALQFENEVLRTELARLRKELAQVNARLDKARDAFKGHEHQLQAMAQWRTMYDQRIASLELRWKEWITSNGLSEKQRTKSEENGKSDPVDSSPV